MDPTQRPAVVIDNGTGYTKVCPAPPRLISPSPLDSPVSLPGLCVLRRTYSVRRFNVCRVLVLNTPLVDSTSVECLVSTPARLTFLPHVVEQQFLVFGELPGLR